MKADVGPDRVSPLSNSRSLGWCRPAHNAVTYRDIHSASGHQPDQPRWLRKSRVRSTVGESKICSGGPCSITAPRSITTARVFVLPPSTPRTSPVLSPDRTRSYESPPANLIGEACTPVVSAALGSDAPLDTSQHPRSMATPRHSAAVSHLAQMRVQIIAPRREQGPDRCVASACARVTRAALRPVGPICHRLASAGRT